MVCAPPSSLPQRASCIGFLTRGCSRVTPHCVNSLRINCTLQALAGLCSHTRETRVRRVRCLTPIVCPLRGQRADKSHDKRARRAPGRALPHIRPIRPMPKQHTHTHTWLEEATTCRAHPGANTPGKGRHTPHRHARAQRRAPLSDCDTVSVRDISTISQILVADAAGA